MSLDIGNLGFSQRLQVCFILWCPDFSRRCRPQNLFHKLRRLVMSSRFWRKPEVWTRKPLRMWPLEAAGGIPDGFFMLQYTYQPVHINRLLFVWVDRNILLLTTFLFYISVLCHFELKSKNIYCFHEVFYNLTILPPLWFLNAKDARTIGCTSNHHQYYTVI